MGRKRGEGGIEIERKKDRKRNKGQEKRRQNNKKESKRDREMEAGDNET